MDQNDLEYQTSKLIRDTIFSYKQVAVADCDLLFEKMDQHLYSILKSICKLDYKLIHPYFAEVVLKVASGNTNSKNYFVKRDNEDSSKKKVALLTNSDLRFLSVAHSILRPIEFDPEAYFELIKKTEYMRGTIEVAIEDIVESLNGYFANEPTAVVRFVHLSDEVLQETLTEVMGHWEKYTDIRESIIKAYMRLAYSIAVDKAPKKSTIKGVHVGTKGRKEEKSIQHVLSNFQNGCAGLIKAIQQYTPARFATFPVVARSWIMQSILLELKNEVNFIKLPIGIWNTFKKIDSTRKELEAKYNRTVSEEEIAEVLGMPVIKIKKVIESVQLNKVFSLDVPTANEEEQGVASSWNRDSIEDQNNMMEDLERRADFEHLKTLVSEFSNESRLIFGLHTGCIDLIEDPVFTEEQLLAEILRQKMAHCNIEVII